ncbi:MAG: PEP-utilizing enzyme [Patescibacteria group bacterium]
MIEAKMNRIIRQAINTEWFFLTERPDMPPLPVWYKIKHSALSHLNKKLYGTGIPWACFWHDNKVEHYLHGREYRAAIRRSTQILFSPQKLRQHISRLEKSCAAAKKAAQRLESLSWRELDDRRLFAEYARVIDNYILSYIYGFITWCTLVLEYEAKSVINRYASAFSKINILPDQALSVLIVPDKLTIYQEKDHALAGLAKAYRRVLSRPSGEKYIRARQPRLYSAIQDFVEKYSWVGFNYDGPALDFSAAVKEIWQYQAKTASPAPSKRDIYRICHFTAREKELFKALEMISYTKDLRNATDDYVHNCFSNFYQVAASRTGLAKSEIKFLWDDELESLLAGGGHFTGQYLEKKHRFCVAIARPQAAGFKQYYIGNSAKASYRTILKNSNKLSAIPTANFIKGVTAASGYAVGKVKLVRSVGDVHKVGKGDILVASMTSPKYMPAIINAAAIITDDGGLTCHAAIIAREIKKPCLIGTKLATRILRDGDLVAVAADQGIVTIIKKHQ